MSFNMLGRGEASRVQTGVVSANFFDVLGVHAARSAERSAPTTIRRTRRRYWCCSYAYWQHALGGDPAIVGRTFELNDRIHTVVGVLPPIPQFRSRIRLTTSTCRRRPARSARTRRQSRTGTRAC